MKYNRQKNLLTVFSFFLIFFVVSLVNGQKVDPNFYPVTTNTDFPIVNVSAIQPDGKILIAGIFSRANGFQQSGVARLLPDGKTDESFQPVTVSSASFVYDLKIQPDGKILIAGDLSLGNGQPRNGIARLNTDGSLDTNFASFFPYSGYSVAAIALQPDGKIVVAGNFPASRNFVRLNGDGTIDGSFQNSLPNSVNLTKLILQPDGRILVVYQIYETIWKTKIVRLNSNGSSDAGFATVEVLGTGSISGGSPTVNAMLQQADGKTVISGSLTSVAGVSKNRLARLNPDGTLDNSFQAAADAAVFALTMQPDGKILASGLFSQINGVARKYLARLNDDGSLDNSLSASFPGPFTLIKTISLQPDGKIIIGGEFLNVAGVLRYCIARLNADGSFDGSFDFVLIGTPGLVSVIAPRADGKIFIGGQFSYVGDEHHSLVALLNSDGTLDKSFRDLNFGDNFGVTAILPLPDNKVLVGGSLSVRAPDGRFYNNLIRFNADGTLDTTFPNTLFPSGASVASLALQPDGKVLVGGLFNGVNGNPSKGIFRLNPDSSLDATFHTDVAGANYFGVSKIALQSDGKILIGGYFMQVNGVSRSRIARLNSDGSLDTTFQNGMAGFNNANNTASVQQIELQTGGKILAAGDFETVNGVSQKNLTRLNPDGSVDTVFSSNFTGMDGMIFGVAAERNGKILIAGNFNTVNGQARHNLAQLNSDGSLDTSFSVNTSTNFVGAYSFAVESNGNVLVGGSFGLINNQTRAGVFRIINSHPTAYDFDGDGKADISVFRPSNGVWYLLNSTSGFAGMQFGYGTDKLVPADYDGDGKTDVAVFRDGTWYLQRSTLGFTGIAFGQAGDIPVPADYDGDGKAEIAVFRPSNGVWYIYNLTTNQFTAYQFGQMGDIPVAADYDGDGKADIAVYRPSQGTWYIQKSRDGFTGFAFGTSEDKPVVGDYDGDGKADIAVYRPSQGTWYLQQSTAGFTGFQFGVSTDLPVPADYDGDGKTDIAVYRNGTWYIQQSKNGFTGVAFGAATDRPVPNAFVP